MMARHPVTIGTLLLLLLMPAHVRGATPLYDMMKKTVEAEQAHTEPEPEIVEFVTAALRGTGDLSMDDIRAILTGKAASVCSVHAEIEDYARCMDLEKRAQALARNEMRIRSLGRSLQALASSYEQPMSDLPGRSLRLSADLRAILTLWSAGTGSTASSISTPLIRNVSVDAQTFAPLLTAVGEAMDALSSEERTAAVWRYQYGVRLIRGERAPQYPPPVNDGVSGPGTERQHLHARWSAVETALLDVWKELQKITFDPPLSPKETAYVTFSAELLDELPDNVVLWARMDGNTSQSSPYGDVGLQWTVPIDPVFPSLIANTDDDSTPILGGDYPPDSIQLGNNATPIAIDGRGLCTSPVHERGYLCRPFEVLPPEERCPPEAGKDPDEIQLVHCTNPSDAQETRGRSTLAGPDVCREVTWKDPEPFNSSQHCKLAFRCAQDCAPGVAASAVTDSKNAQGVISICISANIPDNATYLLLHEMVHAYQLCSMPPGYNALAGLAPAQRNAVCCTREGEAYRAQCDMMARDGVFRNSDGSQKTFADGTPMTAQACAEIYANFACGRQQGMQGCATSRTYTSDMEQAMFTVQAHNPAAVPFSCQDAINPLTMDARVRQWKETIERRDDVCQPGQVDIYKNRIGNNMCYVGQCVELSSELHALSPGRSPVGVADAIAPWNDPSTGTPLGNVLMNPPLTQAKLPPYRPELLMREMDIALCQLQGLPPRTPPILCTIDAGRQLDLLRITGADTALGLEKQANDEALNVQDLMSLSRGVGARAGAHLYGTYMRESNRSFAGMITIATELLEELEKINFPTEMCPADGSLPSLPAASE